MESLRIRALFAVALFVIWSMAYSSKIQSTNQPVNTTKDQSIEYIDSVIKEQCRKEAIAALTNGNLEAFDALVGEASCQIRAIAMVLMYRKMQKKGIVGLSENDLEFATLAYMLTKAKGPIEKFDYDRRKLDHKLLHPTFARNKVEKVMQNAQKELAGMSVKFLQDLAKKSDNNEIKKALDYVLLDIDQPRFKRPHCGCYPSISFILDVLLEKQIPLILVVRAWDKPLVEAMRLAYISRNEKFVKVKQNEINDDEAVVVISGYSDIVTSNPNEFQKKLKNLGVKDIILATFAVHPEFTGEQREKTVPYEELGLENLLNQKKEHKEIAEEYGCSLAQKGLFLATHIFPSTYKREVIQSRL